MISLLRVFAGAHGIGAYVILSMSIIALRNFRRFNLNRISIDVAFIYCVLGVDIVIAEHWLGTSLSPYIIKMAIPVLFTSVP